MMLTRDEQEAELQRKGSGTLLPWARPAMFLLAAGLGLVGAKTGQPVFYAAASVAALVALAVWLTVPHRLNAVRGLREGIRQEGTVEIIMKQWPDGVTQHEACHGRIFMNQQPLWEMEFVTPHNWQPAEGTYPAQLAFIRGVDWPVVVMTRDGLLYPRVKPEKITGV
ncbi:MAG: hypothetical protein R6W75_06035 [Smithellaceae bacterium]